MHFAAENREGGDEKEGCPRFIIKVMGTEHERGKKHFSIRGFFSFSYYGYGKGKVDVPAKGFFVSDNISVHIFIRTPSL